MTVDLAPIRAQPGSHEAPCPTGHRAAFFDLDKTLIPGSSLFLLARGLRRRNFYGTSDIARFAWHQLGYRVGGSERAAGIRTAREAALEFVQGRSRPDMRSVASEVAEELIVPSVYQGMTQLIDGHRRAGDLTFIATAAPVELAEIVAAGLGMSGGLGTHAEVDENDRYSGQLSGSVLHGSAKADAVQAHASRWGIDLGASAAYSDSINDLPLLELVGRAQVVNPDPTLRRLAAQRGWPVHELRPGRRRVGRRSGRPPRPRLSDRMMELGLAAAAEGRGHHRSSFIVDDADALIAELVSTGRFHRDSRLGSVLHPGKVSLREISAADSLHIIVGDHNRVWAHLDRHSPLSLAGSEGEWRYSPARVAIHNVSSVGAAVSRLGVSRRRR